MQRRTVTLSLLPLALGACAGVPLGALPRLYRLQQQVLEMDPGELTLALQIDARLAPPAGTVPTLHITLRPAEPGAFEPLDRKLPMQLDRATGGEPGLPAAVRSRQWLLYSLPPASQAELRQIQASFRRIRAEREGKRGGSLSIGIDQAGLAPNDPAWAASRWETWLRTSRAEGFWELWSGPVADLLAQGRAASAGR
jgi:hypothetical protein